MLQINTVTIIALLKILGFVANCLSTKYRLVQIHKSIY